MNLPANIIPVAESISLEQVVDNVEHYAPSPGTRYDEFSGFALFRLVVFSVFPITEASVTDRFVTKILDAVSTTAERPLTSLGSIANIE